MVTGMGMVGAILINKSPVTLTQVTPIARLTGEYEVLVVPADRRIKTMADLVAKSRPTRARVVGRRARPAASTTHCAGMIVQAAGGDAAKFNYIAFGGGGEVLAQIMGGHVTVGIGGYNEFAAQIKAGKLRALGHLLATKRLPGVNIPTLKEQGIDVELSTGAG